MLGTKASPVTYLHMEVHQFDLDILLIAKIIKNHALVDAQAIPSCMEFYASHVVNGHGVSPGPGPQYSPITHEWAQTSPKGLELWKIRVSGFPFIFIDQFPSMIWSRQKQTQTHSKTLKQGESSISHAHTFNNLPVLKNIYIHMLIYIYTHLDMYKYKYTWFVTSLSFTSLSTGCRHATMGAVDDFDFASVATVIGRSANHGGSSFASSPLKGDFYASLGIKRVPLSNNPFHFPGIPQKTQTTGPEKTDNYKHYSWTAKTQINNTLHRFCLFEFVCLIGIY